ncbi:hypothetical protein [Agathobaculum hominis]|uniref:Uncharacterized protein n=1 Tax=Agathobaculum hominis TaxID=2763014 RepID=A0ABR7GQ17_9FIRM|nr:hypothetical protein [Agathobaculum hominis]MBC5696418.1 hypothetical protein [Agathobaculum hominis]
MELEEKLKAAKVPMIVVHFDENFETTNITWRILNSQNGRLRALLEFYCLQFVSIIKIPNMCKRLMNGQISKTSA